MGSGGMLIKVEVLERLDLIHCSPSEPSVIFYLDNFCPSTWAEVISPSIPTKSNGSSGEGNFFAFPSGQAKKE